MDINNFDKKIILKLRTWGIPFLRVSLGIVFLWFGVLKIIGASPVKELVTEIYSFLPPVELMMILGVIECVIGLGLIFKIQLRFVLFMLWVQMAGTFLSFILLPTRFFMDMNPFLLTTEGEFIIKNIVLVSAGMVVGGFEVKKNHEA
jgi:uncharacterized membrane protein YkgB